MEHCTVNSTLDFISKRWTMLILHELHKAKGKLRYSELKKNIPDITPKLLSARLKELTAEGLIDRETDTSEVPMKSYYSLTKSGRGFISIISEIKRWSLAHRDTRKECNSTDCRYCDF